MSNQTIGTGAVVLTADADGLLKGLKKAEKDTESWADRTGKKINGAAESLEKFNKVPGLLGLGVTGAIAGVGAAIGAAFLSSALRAEQFNKAVERSIELNEKLAKVMDRRAEENAVRLDAESASPGDRLTEIERQLRGLDAEVGAAEINKKRLESDLEMQKFWGKRSDPNTLQGAAYNAQLGLVWLLGQLEDHQKPFEDNLKAADERLQKALELRTQLNKERDRIIDPERDIAKVSEINQLTEAFKIQAATIGKAENAAKALELQLRGFSEGQIHRFKVEADKAEKLAEGFNKVADAVGGAAMFLGGAPAEEFKQVTDALKKQADTIGFTADQIQIYDLRMKGWAERQLDEVKKLQQGANLLGNLNALGGAIANGVKDTKLELSGPYLTGAALSRSTEAYSAVANFRAQNAVAGLGMSDNPVQIAKEELKISKEQIRKLQKLIDILDTTQVLKVIT
ncbi:hypothetical protein VT84_03325 [Gemmata sp. SH-PL17]|uniref:hypothetical protein n=1 Tax=Gemmata sp. SH-PL17 TaxID=1630693 RepID=UPI00078B6754|nr:hypothetical protein [Gemmata sp. SH-PL17]AMV23414.1 hypothetical protein VT84_03325 [Gemmata sp. SH-PL17]